MKDLFFVLMFFVLTKFSFGQTNSIVGAWYWSDSSKAMSIFVKKDGRFSMYSGPKGQAILAKRIREGTYSYSNHKIVIKWQDLETETNALEFLDENRFQITLKDKAKRKRVYIFNRIVDEVSFQK